MSSRTVRSLLLAAATARVSTAASSSETSMFPGTDSMRLAITQYSRCRIASRFLALPAQLQQPGVLRHLPQQPALMCLIAAG